MKVWTNPGRALALLRSMERSWRIELAALAGAGAAAMVVTGAMLAGHSVKESLRDLNLRRLGEVRVTVRGEGEFPAVAARLFAEGAQAAPVLMREGLVRRAGRRERAALVGVDERFYRFHGVKAEGPKGDEVWVSPGMGVADGEELELRSGWKVRARQAPVEEEFTLRAEQRAPRTVFVELGRLGEQLGLTGQANVVLTRGRRVEEMQERARREYRLEDLGYELKRRKGGEEVILEHRSGVLDDRMAEAALAAGLELGVLARPTLAGELERIKAVGKGRGKPVPGRVAAGGAVVAVDDGTLAEMNGDRAWRATKGAPPVVLAYGTAAALGVRVGERVELEIRGPAGRKSAVFEVAGVANPGGLSGTREWSEARAWVRMEVGRRMFGRRGGSYTAVRFAHEAPGLEERLREGLDPMACYRFTDERALARAAAAGSVDLGDYFVTLNGTVVVAALLVLVEFFRLGVKRRRAQIRWLGREGWLESEVQDLFLLEGVLVVLVGVLLGVALAPAYAGGLLWGLKTLWFEAAGVSALRTVVAGRLMVWGGVAGLLMGWLAVWQAVRHWGTLVDRERPEAGWTGGQWARVALAGLMFWLLALASAVEGGRWGMYFCGALLWAGLVAWTAATLERLPARLRWKGWLPGPGSGAAWRRGRAVAMMALLGGGAFAVVSAEAFRSGVAGELAGFRWYGEAPAEGARRGWIGLRVWEGDDISARNLYMPQRPRVVGVPPELLAEKGFRFAASVGVSAEAKAQPWRLLESQWNQGVIPAVVEREALEYVLRKRVGDEFEVEGGRVKIVAVLEGAPFPNEVLIHEKDFERLYPEIRGPRAFLGKAGAEPGPGWRVVRVGERVEAVERVDDVYLSMFQTTGLFSLAVGVLGLGASVMGRARAESGAVWRSEAVAVLGAGLLSGAVCALPAVSPALGEGRSGWTLLGALGGLVLVFVWGLVVIRGAAARSGAD